MSDAAPFAPTHAHDVPDDHEHDVVEMDDSTCAFCGLPVVAIAPPRTD